jgi:hypothetical protein
MMKLSLYLICIIISSSSFAAEKNYGLGAVIGSATGIAGNYKLSKSKSIDATLSFGTNKTNRFQLQSTLLTHKPESLKLLGQVLGWYYGMGAIVKMIENDNKDELNLGARVSAGVVWDFPEVPCDLFADSAFILNVLPKTSADLDLSIGARYYF